MRVIVGITMYNEIEHVYRQLDNCLELECYDEIVVLDDGSTDGTWDVLEEYTRKYNNIHVFRSDKNSILEYGENRWFTLYKKVSIFNPTWINIRAADMLYSYPTKELLRPQLKRFMDNKVFIASLPMVHLWRSETWYRTDNIWGENARKHMARTFYLYSPNAKWNPVRQKAGMHQGAAVPDHLGFPGIIKSAGINADLEKIEGVFPIVGLHLGHTTHEKKVKKFHWSMESAKAAAKYGRSISMPPPENMPPLKNWMQHNGYKGFVEWNMGLAKVSNVWYKEPVIHDPKPKPQSIYEEIKKWRPDRAEEYKEIFERLIK